MRSVTLAPLHNAHSAAAATDIAADAIDMSVDMQPVPPPMYYAAGAPRRPTTIAVSRPQFVRPRGAR
jgi:hypothetical protein